MHCSLQEAGDASTSLHEEANLTGDHLFTLCGTLGALWLDFVGYQTTIFNHRKLYQDQEEADFLLQWEMQSV